MKQCKNCSHTLAASSFDRLDASPDGLHPHCRACLIRFPRLNRHRCASCGCNRLLAKFDDLNTDMPCQACAVSADRPTPNEVMQLYVALENAGLRHGGPHRTVTEILLAMGLPPPTKVLLNAAAAWLRSVGFRETHMPGRKGFRISIVGESMDNGFRTWADTYGALEYLQLSTADRDRYMRGVEPPMTVRLAMSALVAGLPPYSACVTGNSV